jgi:hypothetical protein
LTSDRIGLTVAADVCHRVFGMNVTVSQRVNASLKGRVATEHVGVLMGLVQPVIAYNVALAASQPALRIIEGGPNSA